MESSSRARDGARFEAWLEARLANVDAPLDTRICRDSSVGIATGYGLDGRGSNPGRGKIFLFSTASGQALGPTQPPIQQVPGALSRDVKLPGRETQFSAEVNYGGAVPSLI
jgi:hypothetical protein